MVQHLYLGPDCDAHSEIHVDDMPYSTFYCDAQRVCDVNQILRIKNYVNNSCAMDNNFWSQSSSILNVCWPNEEYQTSAIIRYDGDSKYIIERFRNQNCTEPVLFSMEYTSGQCVDGHTLEILGPLQCEYWISAEGNGLPLDYCHSMSRLDIMSAFEYQYDSATGQVLEIRYEGDQCVEDQEVIANVVLNEDVVDVECGHDDGLKLLTLKVW